MTKQKTPAINLGSSPARPARKTDINVAPGQYDDGIRFNSAVKPFKIGQKRERAVQDTIGPGQYNPEIADIITKNKAPNVNLGSTPARPMPRNDVDVAPG